MNQKRVFQILLAALAVLLMLLPLMVSVNDILTRVVERFGWYQWIQKVVVPLEVKMVGVVVQPLGIDFVAYPRGFTVNNIYAEISWNCIGWQSLVLFLLSLPFGFKGGHYVFSSKLEAFLIGVLSLFLINILRMVLTVVLLVYSRPLFAYVFHDYLAATMTIIWLIVFWWFAYAFVLEEKKVKKEEGKNKLLRFIEKKRRK